jgi:hypothetical protein
MATTYTFDNVPDESLINAGDKLKVSLSDPIPSWVWVGGYGWAAITDESAGSIAVTAAQEALSSADIAVAAAEESAESAAESADSASLALALSNYVGSWSSATGAASKPASYGHNGAVWALNVDLADITLSEPSLSNDDWQIASQATLTTELKSVIIPASGTLQWGAVNEFLSASTVTMPLASAVDANTFLDVYVSEKHKGITVTINSSGSDTFNSGVADNQLILNFTSGGAIRITSDGISELRI